jgi:hypothetical protein
LAQNTAVQVGKDTVVGAAKEAANTIIGLSNAVNSLVDSALGLAGSSFSFGQTAQLQASTPGESSAMLGTSAALLVVVGDGLPLAVGLAGEVVVCVVGVCFGERGRKICVGHAAISVVGERGRVAISVLDAGEVVFSVVGVVRDMARRIGNASQTVGIVIGVRGGLAVLVGHRSPPTARIVRKRRRGGVGIGDRRETRHGVIAKRRLMRNCICDRSSITFRVVPVGSDIALRIGNRGDETRRVPPSGALSVFGVLGVT